MLPRPSAMLAVCILHGGINSFDCQGFFDVLRGGGGWAPWHFKQHVNTWQLFMWKSYHAYQCQLTSDCVCSAAVNA